MHVQAYSFDGKPLPGAARVPVDGITFNDSLFNEGGITLSLGKSSELAAYRPREKLRPWRTLVAVIDGRKVISAGPVLRRTWGNGMTVTAGSGMSFFDKRLVLNYDLHAKWKNGEVLIDEENPSPEWLLSFRGLSLPGIANALLRETLKWGPLPIDPPSEPLETGIHERNYRCFDFARMSDRLSELSEVINGPKLRCVPRLTPEGNLRFKFDPGFVGVEHDLSTTLEGHGVALDSVDEDGGSIASEVFGMGGRDENLVLTARERNLDTGLPLLQTALSSAGSVTRLSTLQEHVNQAVVDGTTLPESTRLRVRASRGVKPGDVINLTTSSVFYGGRVTIRLNVVQVSGDAGDWVNVDAFPEGGDDGA